VIADKQFIDRVSKPLLLDDNNIKNSYCDPEVKLVDSV